MRFSLDKNKDRSINTSSSLLQLKVKSIKEQTFFSSTKARQA